MTSLTGCQIARFSGDVANFARQQQDLHYAAGNCDQLLLLLSLLLLLLPLLLLPLLLLLLLPLLRHKLPISTGSAPMTCGQSRRRRRCRRQVPEILRLLLLLSLFGIFQIGERQRQQSENGGFAIRRLLVDLVG